MKCCGRSIRTTTTATAIRTTRVIGWTLVAVALLSCTAVAQTTSIGKQVICGGGGRSLNVPYRLVTVVGQPCVGQMASAHYAHVIGFLAPSVRAFSSADEIDLPTLVALSQNTPNPFNPATTIRYDVPSEGRVCLVVYNVMGQTVRVLVDGDQVAGRHAVLWDGTDAQGRDIASGVYLCRMEAGDYHAVRKMLLLR